MTAQHEADEAAIRLLIDQLVHGVENRDTELLRRIYAPDIVSFDVQPPLQHVGFEAKLRNWAPVFQGFDTIGYEVRDLALTVGGDVAFGHAFGRLSGTLKDGTKIPGMWVRVTYCLQKTDGDWRLVHDQVSVPLDVTTGRGVIDLEP